MSELRIRNLTKRFTSRDRDTAAIDGITLDIREGEFFVLLGPSGCGKSTLLNLIAGLEKPTGGSIHFGESTFCSADERVSLSPRRRNIAMVFQTYALYPHMTVRDNIAFPLRIGKAGREEIDRSVDETAALLGLTALLSSRPGELSGGQRQRVAIARAIVRRPNVFLLDEPLSNLDAQLRSSTRAELKRIQRRLGITTVYVTHDQVEAMTLGDRVAVLRRGKIEQTGTPGELYETPANTFVATFIGSPPMNLLSASMAGERFAIAGQEIDPGEDARARARSLDRKEFLAGIRPEHLSLAPPRTPGCLPVEVGIVEMLGRELLVHGEIGGEKIAFLTSGAAIAPGETVWLRAERGKIRVFEEGK